MPKFRGERAKTKYGCATVTNMRPRTRANWSGDLLFEGGQEVEGFEGGELVEVGGAEFVEDFAVERREQYFLMRGATRAIWRWRGAGSRCAVRSGGCKVLRA